MHNKGIYENGNSVSETSELSDMDIENNIVCMGECMECNVERKMRKETYMFDQRTNEESFGYDEMNYSENNSENDYEVLMTTLEEEENSDDETVSIDDEDDEERHRGICENCHKIGIIGTACSKCDTAGWAQVMTISEGWQEYLGKQNYEESLNEEQIMTAMRSRGIGLCGRCTRIGPTGFYCRACVKDSVGMINRDMYVDQDQWLEKGEGVCFGCRKIWKENTVCPHCCECIVARLQ
jgi:hypothetical protein